jgi:hypothetical protein
MAEINYYVALPFLFTDDGILLGNAVECPSASAAIVRAEIMARKICNAGAIAFCRNCNPGTGAFGDPKC